MIRLADRQGLLQGSLNTLQLQALQWLIIDEMRAQNELEEMRAKIAVLAGNPALYQHLWPEGQEEKDIKWITPQSQEEVENIVNFLESLGGSEEALTDNA